MPKSTLVGANEKNDLRVYQNFAMSLVKETTTLYKGEKLRIGLEEMIYAFDSSIIEVFEVMFLDKVPSLNPNRSLGFLGAVLQREIL